MSSKTKVSVVSDEQVSRMVLGVRGHKVMLDSDLAALYQVETKNLNKAVQRNLDRFPEDFMFQLTWEELEKLENLKFQFGTAGSHYIDNQEISRSRFQIGTLKTSRGKNRKYLPYAFTEQGVAMLSSVLRSQQAVRVNIAIMRAFVSLRGMMRSQENIKHELAALKRQSRDHDDKIKTIFLLIDEIMTPPPVPKKNKIGFL